MRVSGSACPDRCRRKSSPLAESQLASSTLLLIHAASRLGQVPLIFLGQGSAEAQFVCTVAAERIPRSPLSPTESCDDIMKSEIIKIYTASSSYIRNPKLRGCFDCIGILLDEWSVDDASGERLFCVRTWFLSREIKHHELRRNWLLVHDIRKKTIRIDNLHHQMANMNRRIVI